MARVRRGGLRLGARARDLAARVGGMDLGEVFTLAVLEAFDQPSFQGYSQPQPITQMGGAPPFQPPPQPVYGPSPLSAAANYLYSQHEREIHEGVAAHVDLDALAEKLATRIRSDMEDRGTYGRLSPLAENVRDRVTAKLVEWKATEAKAAYDAEQEAMRGAYAREQARDREAKAIEAAQAAEGDEG